MDIRKYIVERYGILLNDKELEDLEKYLLEHLVYLDSSTELKNEIQSYVMDKFKGKVKFKFSADNSDLEQALLILKNKAKGK